MPSCDQAFSLRNNELGKSVAAPIGIRNDLISLAGSLLRRRGANSQEEARQHFAFLAQALEFGRPQLFAGYIAWCEPTLAHRGASGIELTRTLDGVELALQEMLPAPQAVAAAMYDDAAREALTGAPESIAHTFGRIPAAAACYLARLLECDAEGARRVRRNAWTTKLPLAD